MICVGLNPARATPDAFFPVFDYMAKQLIAAFGERVSLAAKEEEIDISQLPRSPLTEEQQAFLQRQLDANRRSNGIAIGENPPHVLPDMSPHPTIATRRLKAVWRDGSTHDVTIEIGRPYPSGYSFRCPVRVIGLQQGYSPPDLGGYNEVQAITLSLKFVRFLLEWHLDEGGRLFYPDSDDPYSPDDLPKQ